MPVISFYKQGYFRLARIRYTLYLILQTFFNTQSGGAFVDRDNVWEKIKKNFKEGAALSIEKIEEYSKIGKLKIEEFAAKKKIERNCIDIGERVFDLVETQKASDLANDLLVKKAVENIRAINVELAEIDKKMKAVAEESRSSRIKPETGIDSQGV
jgi:hypothetical protein